MHTRQRALLNLGSWLQGVSLARKALLLVAIPLVFELLFVGLLYGALQNARNVANRQSQLKVLIGQTSELNQLSYDMATNLMTYALTKKESYRARYQSFAQRFTLTLHELKLAVAAQPEQLTRILYVEALWKQLRLQLDQLREAIDGGRFLLENVANRDFKDRLKETTDLLAHELHSFSETFRMEKEADPKAEARSQMRVDLYLCAGILANIFIGLILALAVTKEMAGRLRILVENAELLSSESTLNPPVAGKDEIALLDKVFHQTADRLAEAGRERQELERLRQEFVAMVSHDLRTPLTSVQAMLTLVNMGTYGEINQAGKRRIAMVEMELARLIQLVSDLLELERLDAGGLALDCSHVEVDELFRRAVGSVASLSEQSGIGISVGQTDLEVFADADKIVQVLVNLLSNAIKFSPADSRVELEAVDEGAGRVLVKVVDHGRGIPENQQEVIFDRFRQVELDDSRKKKGTGLGLAICKAIVQSHGGAIGVSSREGEGSTFWFTLSGSSSRSLQAEPIS